MRTVQYVKTNFVPTKKEFAVGEYLLIPDIGFSDDSVFAKVTGTDDIYYEIMLYLNTNKYNRKHQLNPINLDDHKMNHTLYWSKSYLEQSSISLGTNKELVELLYL